MRNIVLMLFMFCSLSYGIVVKDVANVVGVRDNQLIGYGLVVGLNGTGDGSSSQFTRQAISSLLQSVHVKVDPKNIKSKNVAAVMVTAKLPPFSRHGDKIDVEVSSMGDAKSIVGGTLLLTPLRAVDGNIYALAQGTINKGYSLNKRNVKKSATAKIFNGAIVEKEVDFNLYDKQTIRLSLKKADFQTVIKIQKSINTRFSQKIARALDPRTVELTKPSNMSMVEFLAAVDKTDIGFVATDKIIIDEKTGTVVAGIGVRVSPVVLTHKDLTLKITSVSKLPENSQADVYIDRKNNVINMKYGEVTVANIARVLQKLGASAQDIIEIIQGIKQAGAITADLEII